jgi:hypothetical protein
MAGYSYCGAAADDRHDRDARKNSSEFLRENLFQEKAHFRHKNFTFHVKGDFLHTQQLCPDKVSYYVNTQLFHKYSFLRQNSHIKSEQ